MLLKHFSRQEKQTTFVAIGGLRVNTSICYVLQILQVFDSCAGELGPDQFNTFALPYLKDIAYRTREKIGEAHLEQVPLVCKH